MTSGTCLVMRHELLLTAAALLVLMAEIFSDPRKNRQNISIFSIIIYGLITFAGFIPFPEGSLFGEMYIADGARQLMKNI